jgi:hypothetical protein
MTQEYALPEGEGIVTSKVTEITFLNEDFGLPQCLEVSRDGSQTKVNIEELKKLVKSSNAKDLIQTNPAEIVDFYSIKLSAKDAFSKLFASKKINLIDVPGLGSPFATDKHIIEMYIKKVDMLIVAIKVTQIQEAANAIELFLRNQRLSIPIIPVLTFFDIWQESDSFASCRNEEEAIDKAKKIIEEKIPSLAGYGNRTLAISSKTGANINELRDCILNFVETPEMAIVKGRKKTPELLSKKIEQISRELDQITIDIDNSNDKLQKQIQGLIPQPKKGRSSFENFEKDLQRDKTRLISDSKQRIERSVNNIFSEAKSIDQEIVYLSFEEIKQRMRKIEEGVNEKLQQLENDEIKELFDNFKIDLIDKIKRYFAGISDTEIQDLGYLKDSITRDIKYQDYQELARKDKYQVPNINGEIALGAGKTIIDVVLNNITNPQVIFPLIAIPVLMQIKSTIGFIPGIGQSLDILLPGCGIALIWQVISKKNTERIDGAKRDIMQKLSASFNKQLYCDNYSKGFDKNINKIIEETTRKMRDPKNPYFNDVTRITETVNNFKLETKRIKTFIQNQIEVIAESAK